jgi:hypothetical protein
MTSPTVYEPFVVDEVTFVTLGGMSPVGVADAERADAAEVPPELLAVLLNL